MLKALQQLHRPVLWIAAANFAVHWLVAGRYGFHRDELYYMAGGLRFDLGYVDHPLLTPWIAGLIHQIAGANLYALRLLPALAGALTVLLAAAFVRALDQQRSDADGVDVARAQVLAALATVTCPFFLFSHTVYQTNVFDQLVWNFALLLLLFAVSREGTLSKEDQGALVSRRHWLLFGGLVAVGLLFKFTVAVLGLGLVIGLLTVRRKEFANPWLYVGGAVAVLGLVPSFWWQAQHGFPFLTFADNKEHFPPLPFVALLCGMVGVGSLPLVFASVKVLRKQRNRLVGVTTIAAFSVFLLMGTKPYYVNPLFPVAFAAGALALANTKRHWPEAMLVLNLAVLPIMMPVLPIQLFAKIPDPIGELSETVGWNELVQQVSTIVEGLPEETAQNLLVVTANYGIAGALELLWDDNSPHAKPPILSAHNSYAFWIDNAVPEQRLNLLADDPNQPAVLLLGFSPNWVADQFYDVEEIGRITNPWRIENEESGRPILLARGPERALADLPLLRPHFD